MSENKAKNAQSAATKKGERGAALATALIILALLAVISVSVLAVVSSEANIAGGDLQRTQTFYAAQANLERMSNRFNNLFLSTTSPTAAELAAIASSSGLPELAGEFDFPSTRQTFVPVGGLRNVQIPEGDEFVGLNASVQSYRMMTTAIMRNTNAEVVLEREMNNYLIPIFQFGIFGDDDIEIHPGPAFYFNGRVHANGQLYINGKTKLLSNVTTANELVTDVLRNGIIRATESRVQVGDVQAGGINVQLTEGSVNGGPNTPGHPTGTVDLNWIANAVAAPQAGTPNQFGGQVKTGRTEPNARRLLLPLQFSGNSTRELIKRRITGEPTIVSDARFHTDAHIRILIDDEGASDSSTIPSGQGVRLQDLVSSTGFVPTMLGGGTGSDGKSALARVDTSGNFIAGDLTSGGRAQQNTATASPLSPEDARTVRRVSQFPVCVNTDAGGNPIIDSTDPYDCSGNGGVRIPGGSGIQGRILIEVVKPDGTTVDVTQQILSMGVTVGEPNAIIHLQRPMWAAFMQGSRDRNRDASNPSNVRDTNLARLVSDLSNPQGRFLVDGEISSLIPLSTGHITQYDNSLNDESGNPVREASATGINEIVPINVYNVREGAIHTTLLNNQVYERGITSVVEINMRNLSRWMTGVYDTTLLASTPAVSTNINSLTNGYIVYVSDRRGDRPDAAGQRNGIVDNEDIYGNNGLGNRSGTGACSSTGDQNGCERGEDVNGDGFVSANTNELPVPAVNGTLFPSTNRLTRAQNVARYPYYTPALNPLPNYFHRAVRVFNGETLALDGPTANDLTTTRGITIATENMVYIWGSYNTTGINSMPAGAWPDGGSTLNNGGYNGNQVPAAIIADAFSPLSRNWYDASSSLYPEGNAARDGDAGSPAFADQTSVRCGIIAGNNLGALAGDPSAGNGGGTDERRMNGGIHNYPRFLETWASRNWNFVGSLIPLYRSTQALGQYNSTGQIYSPPTRNWAFDTTFTDPARLPPGTPVFQYIRPTTFKQVL